MQPLRPPAEELYAEELNALLQNDHSPKPPGWRLSPEAVCTFILGSQNEPLRHTWQNQSVETIIRRKFYGDDELVERCTVTLAGNRGLMLVGEPGTAKSMLSELLAAAISGSSISTIQGTAGTTEDQIKYSWNYALLLAQGPSLEALVPSPLYTGMKHGTIVRFEELTRCQPEIQDTLVSILSDKVMLIPELPNQNILYAQKGFNIIATANTRDRGVHEMSSALKRRFNFETVRPIADPELETELVLEQSLELLRASEAEVILPRQIVELLVTTFQDLRSGKTEEGLVLEKPSSVMSTAEAVSVSFSAGLDAYYFGSGLVRSHHVVRNLVGTVLKDNPEDARKLKHYFDVVVKARAAEQKQWESFYNARRWLR